MSLENNFSLNGLILESNLLAITISEQEIKFLKLFIILKLPKLTFRPITGSYITTLQLFERISIRSRMAELRKLSEPAFI